MAKRAIEDVRRKSRWHIPLLLIAAVLITETRPVWVFRPTFEHHISLLTQKRDFDFFRLLGNSLTVSVSTTVLAYPAAYSIARYRTLGDNCSFWVLSIRMLPPVVFLIPISILFSIYRLMDTQIGIILAYLTFNIPFATWIIKSFIEGIPVDL